MGRIHNCIADAYAAAAPHHLRAGELLLDVEVQMATPKDFQAWVKGRLGLTVGKVRPCMAVQRHAEADRRHKEFLRRMADNPPDTVAARQAELKRAPFGLALNDYVAGDGPALFAQACTMGLEGIVSKRRSSPYRSGRSPHRLKAKNPESSAARREALEDWGRKRR
jgi:hypothetical protein